MERDVLERLTELKKDFQGDILIDELTRIIYATDASAYREKPIAAVLPKSVDDIKAIVKFAAENNASIIPRAAGTSLAGQVVGNGIVVDVSKYMNKILEVNKEERWVRVQPGVNLNELNIYLKKYDLFFAPETASSTRCMLGGMFGNNSCGAHSILYGSTRDHVIEAKVILSDGSEVTFKPIKKNEFEEKCKGNSLENIIYRKINEILSDPKNQKEILDEYPHQEINRRNNGYAIDQLLKCSVFGKGESDFNMCKLLAGSEGTLAFTVELKLNLLPLFPKVVGVIPIHMNSLEETFEANLIALKYKPGAVELIDNKILECTKVNIGQQKNRFFIKGDPAALLVVEFARDTKDEIMEIASQLESEMRKAGYGFHFPVLFGDDVNKVWSLRNAGLGLLSNIPGDKRPEPFIEDTCVRPVDLPNYMKEFHAILKKNNLDCVYYAHIGSGELHLRPMLNLKDSFDVKLFYSITNEIAHLVKKYKGSLSGEHGDGRLRGEFIPIIIGQHNYELCKEIKKVWDPKNIFNPGKIVDTPKMNTSLRYEVDKGTREIQTIYDFSSTKGILRAAERCNGSGDCRKSDLIGGTMCPSYRATRDEKNTTRARANTLREILTRSKKENPFDHKEIYEVMDLCLSCKACKSECPSSVDMAKLKSEFLQHYYDANGIPLRTKLIAYLPKINSFASNFSIIVNQFLKLKLINKLIGFSTRRKIPLLSKQTFVKWYRKNSGKYSKNNFTKGKIYLFVDEFTNYNEADLGIKTFLLLTKLGYEVIVPKHLESGRTFITKGLLRKAKNIANENIKLLKDFVSEENPLVGIEVSAILAFRDEYLDLVNSDLKPYAEKIAKYSFTIEEFLSSEIKKGKISKDSFTTEKKKIKLHGHCQQKAIASTQPTIEVLSFPLNYQVEEIPSGCCGMAGSFGYEKEHYEISMKIGELVLFPAIRNLDDETLICAPGTSCRHQIKDGVQRAAYHPVEIIYDALIK
ncbi:FAD-binding and (Fe-S)-binding domain-containing protein [Melioribacteraceae bacterium 4301-Me]|uniref:FAD-binding and (Fe-S)-binding domain-containing protein n=1 Tax=Pyranulibacter aquaticus TaxID=3163344 RepID=UPI003594AEC1